MENKFTLGIDLGTTNTYVAIKKENQNPELVFFGQGTARGDNPSQMKTNLSKISQFPSIVNITKRQAGKEAAAEYITALRKKESIANFVRNFKRELEENKVYHIGNSEYHATDIMEIFVRDLLKQVLISISRSYSDVVSIAKQFRQSGLNKIAVTVPSAWKDEKAHNKEKVLNIFLQLGFQKKELVLLYEPVAAAAYSYYMSKENGKKRYAVVDLGGGTSDYAIVSMNKSNGHISSKIEDHNGNPNLGGKDFDERIYYKITINHFHDNEEMGRYIAEDIKINYGNLKIDPLFERVRLGFEYSKDLVTKIDRAIERNLDEISVSVSHFFNNTPLINQINEALMVGGLSLFPPVFDTVNKVFSNKIGKYLSGIQYDEITFCSIALGAAVLAEEGNVVEEILNKDILLRIEISPELISFVTDKVRSVFNYTELYKYKGNNDLYLIPLFKKGTVLTMKNIKSSFEKIYGKKLGFDGNQIEFNLAFEDYEKLITGENNPVLLNVKHEVSELNFSSCDFDLRLSANGILKIIIVNSQGQFLLEDSIKFKK